MDSIARSQRQTLEKVRANHMMDIRELTTGRFYTMLDDLVADLEDAEIEIEDANAEEVSGWREEDGEDVFYTLTLDGTVRTFFVKEVKREVM